MAGVGQCMARVSHIVRHPHWLGDWYCVCPKHLDWAKGLVAKRGPMIVVATGNSSSGPEIVSGCVWWRDGILRKRVGL